MRTVQRAELRDSWPAWTGVSLGFVTIAFCLTLTAMVLQSAVVAGLEGMRDGEWFSYAFIAGFNFLLCVVVGLSVVASATSLVIDSRRGSLARLALVGATPSEVTRTIMTQLTAVALASAVLGDVLAVAALRPVLWLMMIERAEDSAGVPAAPVWELSTILAANALWLAVILSGGFRQARRASRIPPVAALRDAQGASDSGPRTGRRFVKASLVALLIGCAFAGIGPLAANRNSETFSQIMQLNMVVLCLTGVLLAQLAPMIVGPLTRAWTALLPLRDASWVVARATVLARAERLARSVVPVMFSVGLAFAVLGMPATYNAIFEAAGFDVRLGHVGPATFLVDLGLALAVAMAGGLGSLFMMSRQRDAELAMLGIIGATPGERTRTALLEAVMITVTAALLGVVMLAAAYAHLALGVSALGMQWAAAVPAGPFLATVAVTGGITAAATVLPTLPARSVPEPRVIARLVAE